jgi:hypothetical protein
VLLEQPLGSAEPALGRAELAPEGEAHADPEGSACSLLDVTGLEVEVVRTLVGADPLLVSAEHVGGRREQAEIGRSERLFLVGAKK